MKIIKIKYCDMWGGFNPDKYIINKILLRKFNIIESDDPDYVIGSVYSKDAMKYNCVRIFYTGENFCPDFNLYDYAIGFENMTYGDRYVQVPNYIMNPKYAESVQEMQEKHRRGITASDKSDFCSYVVSNGNGDVIRDLFFEELCKYKKVNSGGRYKNNIGMPDGVADKLEFQRGHKFSICFENSSHPGYITEKLVEGFAAGTVPIYYGASDVMDIFNENAMIVVRNIDDMGRAIEQIRKIDNDDILYEQMLAQPALKDACYIENVEQRLAEFLENIFSQPLEQAYRRPMGQTVKAYYDVPSAVPTRRCLFPFVSKR